MLKLLILLLLVSPTALGIDWMPPMPEPKSDVFAHAMSSDRWGMVEKSNVTMIDELKDMDMGSVHYGANTTRVLGNPDGSWCSFVGQGVDNTGKGKSTQVAFTMQEM